MSKDSVLLGMLAACPFFAAVLYACALLEKGVA